MVKIFKKELIILILLWIGLLCLTFLNGRRIEKIVYLQKRIENQNINLNFFKRNEKRLLLLLKREKELVQSIENIDLGMVSFKHEVNNIAKRCHISNLQINFDRKINTGGRIRVSIITRSDLKDILNLLNLIKKELPYAPVDKVILRMDRSGTMADSQILLTYRYRSSHSGNRI